MTKDDLMALRKIANIAQGMKQRENYPMVKIDAAQILEILRGFSDEGFCLDNHVSGQHVNAPLDQMCVHCGVHMKYVARPA